MVASVVNPLASQRIRMDCNTLNLDFILWPALPVHLDSLHFCQGRETVVSENVAEDGVLAIQVRRLVEADEELASVGRRPLVCHAHDPSGVVSQGRSDLVLKGLLPDGLAAFGLRRWGASLDHEIGDQPVEQGAVIVA